MKRSASAHLAAICRTIALLLLTAAFLPVTAQPAFAASSGWVSSRIATLSSRFTWSRSVSKLKSFVTFPLQAAQRY